MKRVGLQSRLRKCLVFPVAAVACVLVFPDVHAFFNMAGFRWLYVLLVSFTICYVTTPVFSRLALRFGIVDKPGGRKIHNSATPLLGGASVYLAILITILINGIFSAALWAIIGAATFLFLVGIFDDIREMPAWLKLLAQVICTIGVVVSGIILDVFPRNWGELSAVLNVLLTMLWIVGITNAMNFFDGMDGLASGLSAIIGFFLGVVAFQTGQPFLGWLSIAVMGSCLGFLPYNFSLKGSASVFLGDAGSTVLGFILACLAVYGDWAEGNPIISLASPLLIFWVLIFDMVYISVERVVSGKVHTMRQWIDYVGKDHLHHRLAIVLGGNKKSVLMIYLVSVCLGLSAIVLRNARLIDAVLLLTQGGIIVSIISILEYRGRQQHLVEQGDIFERSHNFEEKKAERQQKDR